MDKKFNVLALSGGGFKGLFTAQFLADFEEQTGKPINKSFDLICGSSIGGILAMALGIGKPAQKLADIIENNGELIFSPKLINRLFNNDCLKVVSSLCSSFYSNDGLKQVVQEIFGDKVLGASETRLLVTAVNYATGKPQFFKTRHHERFKLDHKIKMSDIGMMTSAAPVYFPIWKSQKSIPFIDGGIVANAPGLVGVHEVKHILKRPVSEPINLLSIGTMSGSTTFEGKQDMNQGIFHWGKQLFDVTISAQEALTDYMLKHQFEDSGGEYKYINVPPDDINSKDVGLDVVNPKSIELLKSHATNAFQHFIGNDSAELFTNHKPEIFKPVP